MARARVLRRYRVNPTKLQAFILSKPDFTAREAVAFARRHGARKVEETVSTFRVRMVDPGRLRSAGYTRMRTMTIAPGLKATIAAKGPAPNLPRGALGMIPGRVEEVRYQRAASRYPGPYKHRFGPGAVMFAMKNGDVLLRSMAGKPLWGRY